MILVFGALLDNVIGHLVHRLTDRSIPFLLLDPREYGRSYELVWEWGTSGEFSAWLRHGDTVSSLAEARSAYVHGTSPAGAADGGFRPEQIHCMLRTFLDTAPLLICNRPSASATNFSKTWQQQTVTAAGFAVPRTLVTNIPEEAREFYERCRRRVIYKSLSARRSIVRRMAEADLDRLELLRAGPTQFQEWLPGVDIRVHVMGRQVFATQIETDATDYRYSNREGLPRTMRGIELPAEVAARCVALARALGMVAAGVDLRRTPDGCYYCFDPNPTPGFAFYEQYTGQRIADGLIDALLEDASSKEWCKMVYFSRM